MKRLGWIAAVCGWAVAAGLAGCADRNAARLVSRERMDEGLTLVLPGIEGKGYLNRGIRDGLAAGRVPTAIRIHDWTLGPFMALANQAMESRARRQAQALAQELAIYKEAHPGRPVFLVGHSGGCAIALFAAEAMPAGQTVDGIILMGASVSPEYDLARALEHVRTQMVNFHSHKDTGFLGVATWVFGTMDGRHSSSAGRTGFVLPTTVPEELEQRYGKLRQIPWDPSMELSGNRGGHTDWADPRFVRDYIGPRLRRWMWQLAAESPAPQTQPAETQPESPAPTTQPATTQPASTQPAATRPDQAPRTTQPARVPPTTQPDPRKVPGTFFRGRGFRGLPWAGVSARPSSGPDG